MNFNSLCGRVDTSTAAMGGTDADALSLPQRIVFLIDIHPLLQHNTNPNPGIPGSDYITHIRASIRKILTFPPLSSSLFAFKLFVSSLSPILSASMLHSSRVHQPRLFSFRRPLEALASLSQTFDSIHIQAAPAASPRASLLAKFLLQLDHDYSWEPDSSGNRETLTFPPNLVLLFSPLYRDFVDLDGPSLDSDWGFREFCRIFGPVQERFASRDIHLSWVSVNFHGHCELGFLESGITEMGWGFYSTDAIVVGSAFVPFGLIFPYVGCKMGFSSDMCANKGQAELVLGITDVSGKPLECNSCSLEVIGLKLARERPDFWALLSKKSGGSVVVIRIDEVWRKDETKFTENSAGIVLLRAFSGECKKDEGNSGGDSIMERVLELLCREKGEFIVQKPIWQLLLAFLFRRNYWASVSISDGDGNSHEGVLKPFAVNYALLSILETNISTSCQLQGKCLSKTSESTVLYSSNTKNERRQRDKMHKHMLHGGASWSSFYNVMFRQDDDCAPEMNMEEIYFDTGNTKSKKLRFLKCWMSQMKKLTGRSQGKPNEMGVPATLVEEVKDRPDTLQDEPVMCVSSSPAPETPYSVPSDQELSSFSCLEDLEAFLSSVPQKIEHGMSSKEVDLLSLAERLVGLSIDALYTKFISCKSKDSIHEEVDDVFEVRVSYEVSRLLLMKPKDLLLKHKSSNSPPLTSDQCATNYSTENIIREHELQILFRMELLQSKIAASFEENVKQKIVREICSLLRNIEFYLQGDFLSGESPLEFAGRIIKSRYAHSLGDIIHKIYSEMEFLSFEEEEMEASDSLAGSNGEEPNTEGNVGSNGVKYALEPTAKASSSQFYAHQRENNAKGKQIIEDNVQDRRLMRAQKQRDRARRFSSFTSWVPDFHKVWALKQPRAEKTMTEHFPNFKSKRMKRERHKNEVVCETPMTSMKRSQMQEDENGVPDTTFLNDNSCRLLSKALFPT